jgi:hypothetical protein
MGGQDLGRQMSGETNFIFTTQKVKIQATKIKAS